MLRCSRRSGRHDDVDDLDDLDEGRAVWRGILWAVPWSIGMWVLIVAVALALLR